MTATPRSLYRGEQKRRGRPQHYDGKVRFHQLSRFEFVQETDGLQVYTALVNSVRLKAAIRIACVVKKVGDKRQSALSVFHRYGPLLPGRFIGTTKPVFKLNLRTGNTLQTHRDRSFLS